MAQTSYTRTDPKTAFVVAATEYVMAVSGANTITKFTTGNTATDATLFWTVLYVYPGKAPVSGTLGTLAANTGTVNVGLDPTATRLPQALANNATAPLVYTLPPGQKAKLTDLCISAANATDGVMVRFY